MARVEGLPVIDIGRIGLKDGYLSDDFVITDERASSKELFALPARLTGGCIGICTMGQGWISINMKVFHLSSGTLFVIVPGAIVHLSEQSVDFRFCLTGFSSEFLQEIYQSTHSLYPYMLQHPVISLGADEVVFLLAQFELLRRKALSPVHFYAREIVAHLFMILFYEIGAIYRKTQLDLNQQLSRSEEIFKNLMRLILIHYREERTVAFYAKELCLTPKYLSSVVKQISNKTVIVWIHETVLLDAKSQLQTSRMTVQQIANYLNFPNPSFFGRFFKKYTGLTPNAYRHNERV